MSKANIERSQNSLKMSVDDSMLTADEYRIFFETNPEAASQMMQMIMSEQQHRHQMDKDKISVTKESMKKNFWSTLSGMFFAFLIVVGFFVLAYFSLIYDKPWITALFSLFSIATIVQLFIAKTKDTNIKR